MIRRYLFFVASLLFITTLAWMAMQLGFIFKPVHAEVITFYLLFITAWLVFNLMRLQHSRPERFVVFFLAGMAIKLLAHTVFLLLLALLDDSTLFADVVYFLSLYMIYTLISIYVLYRGVAG